MLSESMLRQLHTKCGSAIFQSSGKTDTGSYRTTKPRVVISNLRLGIDVFDDIRRSNVFEYSWASAEIASVYSVVLLLQIERIRFSKIQTFGSSFT